MKPLTSLGLALLLLAGCKTGPETKPAGPAPEFASQELIIAEQGLTEFTVRFEGMVKSTDAAKLEKAVYELVVDGKVVKSGELPLGLEVAAGGNTPFQLEQTSKYVATAEDLKAMDTRGGSLLTALRGKLTVKSAGGTAVLEFAKSREVRVPRLPHVKLHELDAARYGADEASATFFLGVDNPNPFPVKLSGLDYKVTIGGKQMADGTRGSGEKVAAGSTGVFEVQVAVNKETFGPEVDKLIKTLTLPYVVTGSLKGDLLDEPYELKGDIKLNVSK
ncbi:MAG: LEA/WHy family protein [Myxococcaceae bacterium]